jgi:phosphoserine phosphatase RsbU/P
VSTLDRLVVQIDSLQEGFDILSRAGTAKEMGSRLFRLLRGGIGTVEGCVALRRDAEGPWEILHGRGTPPAEILPGTAAVTEVVIEPCADPRFPLRAVQPLLDGSSLAVVLGRKLAAGERYSHEDRITLRILLQLFASAWLAFVQRGREKHLVFSLNQRMLQLTGLIDTGIELSRTHEASKLHRLALERAAAVTNASQGSVRISEGRTTIERLTFPEGATRARGVPDDHRIRASFRFQGRTYTFELTGKESRSGTVAFEETDRLLLTSLTRQVHAVLETNHLHTQELERQKIERDIAVAASIQQRILPRALPAIEGYELAGINIPTRFVGGDYYDCLPLGDGRFALVIADVAGKGVPAALLVSSFHASLAAYLESTPSPVTLARRLNTAIYRASTEERYITAILAIFDPSSGSLETTNAGHTPLYLHRRNGDFEELNNGGLALGMMDMEFPYGTDRITLDRGDRLLLFTDGVSEAMDARGRLYDTDGRLRGFMTSQAAGSAAGLIAALIGDIRGFAGAAPQADDITAMALVRH